MKSAIHQLRSIELLVRSLVGMFLPLFCVVDLETSNGLMPEDAEDSTLLAVVLNTAERSAVAASLNRDLTIGFRSGAITGA